MNKFLEKSYCMKGKNGWKSQTFGLDCEGEKRVQNRLERKEKELIGF